MPRFGIGEQQACEDKNQKRKPFINHGSYSCYIAIAVANVATNSSWPKGYSFPLPNITITLG
jgi:glycine cleavage system pyridoxal-binding protein P